MDLSPTVPIEKSVVLLGAGNAHLGFVRRFAMKPMPGVAVTLVSEASVIPYSAMVPGHIAGEYPWDETTIDLVRLCRGATVRFLAARATGIDVAAHTVLFPSRAELRYDVLSLGIGSAPARPAELDHAETSWPMRPLAGLLERLNALEARLRQTPRPFHLVVVGGGASGCELMLAIRRRFAAFKNLRLTMVQGSARLLPGFPPKAGDIFTKLMADQGIAVRCNARVFNGDERGVEMKEGERLACDAVLWATHAAPLELLRGSGLRLSDDGFLLVRDTLQSHTDPAIFGTGDCMAIDTHPDLAKNGVYAVRQGAVLFENVDCFLHERPLRPFVPQRRCLCLLNTADGEAVLTYGPLAWKGRIARRLKERIDRAWVAKFTPAPMRVLDDEPTTMRCGGCGSKISSDVLAAVLQRLDVGNDPRIVLGTRAGEDAAVHRMAPELFSAEPAKLVEVQTVDYFKAFVDDPYLFGRIAALNALSDLYAMNARPFAALAIATLPYARGPVQEAMLYEMLTGAVASLRQLGVILTGGNTTEGSELSLGFAATGFAEEDRLFRKSKLRSGDMLILTKPLGSGALLAAWMRGQCRAAWYDHLIATMLQANDRAAAIFARFGVEACTDVTGFGFAGHLLEMLDASGMAARLHARTLRLYQGFTEVVERGIVSTLQRDNAKTSCRIVGDAPAWLFDPQTSGGLLAGVKRSMADEAVRLLVEAGYADAAIIGEATALEAGQRPSIRLDANGI